VLAQTLFLLVMLAIFATSAVAGIAAAARAQTAAAAKALIVPGVETALGRYQRYIAAANCRANRRTAATLVTVPALVPALNAAPPWTNSSISKRRPVRRRCALRSTSCRLRRPCRMQRSR